MTTIRRDVKALQEIVKEIKLLTTKLSKLRKEREKHEKVILEYLKTEDLPGVKDENFVVLAKKKTKRVRPKKNERIERGVELLRQQGVNQSPEFIEALLETLRGEEIETTWLKIEQK